GKLSALFVAPGPEHAHPHTLRTWPPALFFFLRLALVLPLSCPCVALFLPLSCPCVGPRPRVRLHAPGLPGSGPAAYACPHYLASPDELHSPPHCVKGASFGRSADSRSLATG